MIREPILNSEQVNKAILKRVNNIETIFIARIIEYDHIKNKAVVQPLEKIFIDDNTSFDRGLIKCPVMIYKTRDFYIRLPYSKGDVVVCGCSKHALESVLITGEPEVNQLREIKVFNINDAIVLGGIMTGKEDDLSEKDGGSLLIKNRKNNSKISFNVDGSLDIENVGNINMKAPEINIEGKIKHTGEMESSGDHTAGGISLMKHTHNYKEPEHAKPPIPTSAPQ